MAEEQKVEVQTSKKWTVGLVDLLRTTLLSLMTAVSAVVLQFIEAWTTNPAGAAFDKVSFMLALKVAVATWIADIIRRWLKPSQTIVKIKPPIKGLTDDEGVGGSGTEQPSKPPGTP